MGLKYLIKNPSLEKAAAVCSCLLINLISGTIYMFSAFGPQMVQAFSYSDADSSFITSMATYGLNLPGPVVGLVTDRFGPRLSSTIATILASLGYFLMMLSFQGSFGDMDSKVGLMAFFYTLVGFGSSFGYNAGISTLVKNATQEKVGLFSGLGVGFFALTAFILTNIKKGVFPDISSLGPFFFFMTGYCFILGLMAIPFIKVTKPNEVPTNDLEENLQENDWTSDHHMVPTEIPPQPMELAPNDIRGWRYLRHPRFWYLLYNVFIITGAGYMYVMKVGTIITALCGGDPSASMVSIHTAVLPVFNFFGRLSSGAVTDFAMKRFGMSRVYFIGVAALLMATGQAVVVSIDDPIVLLYSTIVIGFTYGFTFATIPCLLSDWFTRSQYGFKWGMILYGTAFGNQMFSSIFSSYHDMHPTPCTGLQCHDKAFEIALVLTAISSLFAFFMAFFLSRKDASSGKLTGQRNIKQ